MIPQTKKIQAVVFDWAGTTIDYGCRAPLAVFLELFKNKGIPITVEEASKPMGKLKIEHIRELLSFDRIKNEYLRIYNRSPSEETITEFNCEFEKALFSILPNFTDPLPHVLETIKRLRFLGLKIGSTTGYTKEMMDIIVPIVERKGYKPDYIVTSNEVKQGRPYPWMLYKNAIKLEIGKMDRIVKVGDTIADIQEGRNADCWSVGVIEGSSLMGLTQEEYEKADKEFINLKKSEVRRKYLHNGADFVINSLTDLPELIEKINYQLNSNILPGNKVILPNQPYKLFTPGPLTTSTTVKLEMMTDWGSRESDYLELVQKIRKDLVELATENNREKYSTILMQGSGTFGIESCIGSVIPREGKILVLINGAYGKRMNEISKVLNIETLDYEVDETSIHDLRKIEEILKNDNKITHVGYIHSETTTGLVNPIERINPLIKKYNKVSIVDAMSSYGALPIDMSNLDIDFLISSSNKNLEGVPGFSFIIANKNQLDKCKSIPARSLSLDLYKQYRYLEDSKGGFRFTSPVHCIRALSVAIRELKLQGGVKERYKRYCEMQQRLVEGMKEMRFRELDLKGYQGPIITTFHTPNCPKFNFNKFYERLKDHGCVIYPGKLSVTDSFRIGTIGSINIEDIEYLLQCIKNSIFWNNNV